MQRSKVVTGDDILNGLLDRHESPRERVRDITQRIDYNRVGGPAEQDSLHRVLRDAERAGGVRLEADRLERFTGEIARVRLTNADALYRFLNRSPSADIAVATRQRIESACPEISREPFFEAILIEASAAWTINRRVLDLRPTDSDDLIEVFRLTHGIIHWAERDIDHRTFSRRTVGDSKALERHEGRVAALLRRWNPTTSDLETREVLQAHGIVRRAHPLFLRGPIRVVSDSMRLEGSGVPFVGLPWSTIRSATLHSPIDYTIIIENPTSFWRYCMEIEGQYLALLSDGFPARDVLAGIVHMVHAAQPAPLFHWGDIDAGGIKIAKHLEDACGVPLRLHEMTPELAVKWGTPLKSRTGLERLVDHGGKIGSLAQWLQSSDGQALEQEQLNPRPPPT
ncbi:Wadjet anti-phage system protein JetD domain-containing protein [Tepidicaulis sp. LMO-SS28]|uniref:Wadjet anti-phage system protein JetD domain-containing protein n=1 Tax=Tepidicaulis sp. LMO-SS28 TaxID=3447455 RepID=UPI003EE0B0FC